MKTFRLACRYVVAFVGEVEVEAETLEEAQEVAEQDAFDRTTADEYDISFEAVPVEG